ncbi:MAG: hypothetical protein ACP5OR_06415 [Candidatus Dormibacteria bacterium]
MSIMRHTVYRIIGVLIIAALFFVTGSIILSQPHAQSDFIAQPLGWSIIIFGAVVFVVGLGITAFLAYDTSQQKKRANLIVTPRPGDPAPPTPWGMEAIGRPDSAGTEEDERIYSPIGPVQPLFQGKGSIHTVSVTISSLDVPIVIGLLLIWTAIATLAFAPH